MRLHIEKQHKSLDVTESETRFFQKQEIHITESAHIQKNHLP